MSVDRSNNFNNAFFRLPKAKYLSQAAEALPVTGNLSDYELPEEIKKSYENLLAQMTMGK